jgi:hypothetical protein
MLTQGNAPTPAEIDQKDCSTAHKTLGIMKAPNGSQTGEMACLTNKSNQRAAAILSNSVTHSDSLTAYQVYHLTSISYSLGVMPTPQPHRPTAVIPDRHPAQFLSQEQHSSFSGSKTPPDHTAHHGIIHSSECLSINRPLDGSIFSTQELCKPS